MGIETRVILYFWLWNVFLSGISMLIFGTNLVVIVGRLLSINWVESDMTVCRPHLFLRDWRFGSSLLYSTPLIALYRCIPKLCFKSVVYRLNFSETLLSSLLWQDPLAMKSLKNYMKTYIYISITTFFDFTVFFYIFVNFGNQVLHQ